MSVFSTPIRCLLPNNIECRPRHLFFRCRTSSCRGISDDTRSASSHRDDVATDAVSTTNNGTKSSTTYASSNSTHHRHVHRATLRGVHPLHLYRIINDVDEYRNFLPHCHESRVLRVSDCGSMYDAILRVGLPMTNNNVISLGGLLPNLEERYVSRVRTRSPIPEDDDDDDDEIDGANVGGSRTTTMRRRRRDHDTWTVEAKSIRSKSFDSLRSRWELSFAKDGRDYRDCDNDNDVVDVSCDVDFEVEMRVTDPIVSLVLDGVLGVVAKGQVEAFERRCREVPFRR